MVESLADIHLQARFSGSKFAVCVSLMRLRLSLMRVVSAYDASVCASAYTSVVGVSIVLCACSSCSFRAHDPVIVARGRGGVVAGAAAPHRTPYPFPLHKNNSLTNSSS
jgi:hypothetical protein